MSKRADYIVREFAGWIKTLEKRECQQCKGSYLWTKAFEDTVVLVAGRHSGCIWLVHVIFPHVQMTCQLLLNYMRHLDQSAQCQRWLILFIVAVMTVPVDSERHKTHNKGLWEGLGEGCRGQDGQGKGWRIGDRMTVDFYHSWSGYTNMKSDGNISRMQKWLQA